MKIAKQRAYTAPQRQYHRRHSWRLDQGGLFIPHCYTHKSTDDLSWWDDGGFIWSKRRVMVWWQHPRQAYADALQEQAWQLVGPAPTEFRVGEGEPVYRKVGASRKKLVGRQWGPSSAALRAYYDQFRAEEDRLHATGIAFEVRPGFRVEQLSWAIGVNLIAPLEVRNERELGQVLALAKELLQGKTTLDTCFPGYRYGQADWLADQAWLQQQEKTKAAAKEALPAIEGP